MTSGLPFISVIVRELDSRISERGDPGKACVGSAARDKKKKKATFKKVEGIFSLIREVQRWAFQGSRAGRRLHRVIRDPGPFLSDRSVMLREGIYLVAPYSCLGSSHHIRIPVQEREKAKAALSLPGRCPHTFAHFHGPELSPVATPRCKGGQECNVCSGLSHAAKNWVFFC